MWSHVTQALSRAFQWSGKLSESQWFLVLIAVVVIGVFALRGYGSRTSY